MKYIRRLPKWPFVSLGVLLLLGALSNQPVLAKIGLEDFPQAELTDFWEQVFNEAQSQASLIYCGYTSKFEERAIAAVRECVRESSLETVRNVFRQRLASNLSRMRSKTPEPGNCAKWMPVHVPQIEKQFDEMIAFLRDQCNKCLLCHTP